MNSALLKALPKDILQLITLISRRGLLLTLVGGAVRDYFREGQLPRDLDFELRNRHQGPDWEREIETLADVLKCETPYHITKHPFSIIKIQGEDFIVELASPRMEYYDDDKGGHGHGHSDFRHQVFSQLDYRKSFQRRDITINSMGVEILAEDGKGLKATFIDPFHGLTDLQNKIIRTSNKDFFKDPIRFLRIIRFSLKLEASFDSSLSENLSQFNLTELTDHYFFSEALKGHFFSFCQLFFSLVQKHHIPIPQKLTALHYLVDLADISPSPPLPRTREDVLTFLVFFPGKAFIISKLNAFRGFAKIREHYLQQLLSYKATLDEAQAHRQNFSLDLLKEKILPPRKDQKSITQILEMREIHLCHQFFSLSKKSIVPEDTLTKYLPQESLHQYREFCKIIPNEKLKGKELFFKLAKAFPSNGKKSLLRMYAHLLSI